MCFLGCSLRYDLDNLYNIACIVLSHERESIHICYELIIDYRHKKIERERERGERKKIYGSTDVGYLAGSRKEKENIIKKKEDKPKRSSKKREKL